MNTSNNIKLGDYAKSSPLNISGKVVTITQGISGYELVTLEIENDTPLGRSYHEFSSEHCTVITPAEKPIEVASNISLGDYVEDPLFKQEGVVVRIDYNADAMVVVHFENPTLSQMENLECHIGLDTNLIINTSHPISDKVRKALEDERVTLNVGDKVQHVISGAQGTILNILEASSARFIVTVSTNEDTNFKPFVSDLILFNKV